ncbi:unnamed protein product [Gadus morhua 'NCC']
MSIRRGDKIRLPLPLGLDGSSCSPQQYVCLPLVLMSRPARPRLNGDETAGLEPARRISPVGCLCGADDVPGKTLTLLVQRLHTDDASVTDATHHTPWTCGRPSLHEGSIEKRMKTSLIEGRFMGKQAAMHTTEAGYISSLPSCPLRHCDQSLTEKELQC